MEECAEYNYFFCKRNEKYIYICIWLGEKYLNAYQETKIEKVSTDLEFLKNNVYF